MSARPATRGYPTDPAASARMRCVPSRDTKPELRVRSLLWRLGYRFRLGSKLPGRPDVVLPGRRCVLFVHGCFWHRHRCPAGRSSPSNNADLWKQKFERTLERDREHERDLRRGGWRVLVVWECELHDEARLSKLLVKVLERSDSSAIKSRLARLAKR